ncbi:MAG TPA: amidohydrolase family protein, partial [Blastocatellia bacterium]|nr:amidohydrolase family protein [Blastocatellia bacterium]
DPRRKYLSPELAARWRSAAWMWGADNPPLDWKSLQSKGLDRLKAMHSAGVRVMAGTDIPAPLVYPGFGLHDELQQLVKDAGLTTMEALQSATRSPAEFFKMSDSLGTIEKGKIADLVLLDANPLEDIRNTRSIQAVVQNGKLISKTGIQQILDQVAATNVAAALAEEAQAVKVDPKTYDAYVGRYEITPTWRVFVARENDRLMCWSGRLPKFELYPESETRFSAKVIEARVTFVKDDSGKVDKVVVLFKGQQSTGKRMD